jgi:hypothetical protein
VLAPLDFCEDSVTAFEGFLKNDLGMKKANEPAHCECRPPVGGNWVQRFPYWFLH